MKTILFWLYAKYRRARSQREALATACIYAATGFSLLILMAPIAHVAYHGASSLGIDFLLEAPSESGRSGGIGPILVSTLLIVAISLAFALPLALGTSVLMSEFAAGRVRAMAIIRNCLDVLAGVPSVVFGLFGLAFFCRQLGLGYSILAGGLTLGCMILPVMIRTFSTAIDSSPQSYRCAAAALGVSKTATLCYVTLPVALRGLTAGCVLGITRSFAETAVLLFTSGYSVSMPGTVMDSGRSISVHIYELATNIPGGNSAAYGSALVLLCGLAVISVGVHYAALHLQSRLLGIDLNSWR